VKYRVLPPEEWAPMAASAHRAVFGKLLDPAGERYSFVAVAANDAEDPVGYVAVQERGRGQAYLQFGGVFPPGKGLPAVRAFLDFLRALRENYSEVTCLVENTNAPMLRLAQKVGFLIVGLKISGGSILLEHRLEFNGGV
jgi:RimJ/RimL family protein N-acetyltransferase